VLPVFITRACSLCSPRLTVMKTRAAVIDSGLDYNAADATSRALCDSLIVKIKTG
jgi:hypothetical protein